MRFDLTAVLANPDGTTPWSVLLDDIRRRVETADELGFDGIWFGEHHFDAEGSDNLPNPVMLAADLAARTTRIRLGMAAVALPYWHPVRLAEDLAMLDHFSGGRVDVAFSRGIVAGEIINMNPAADRSDEAQSRAIFDENLEIVKRAWTQKSFSWKGPRYQFPTPGSKWAGPAYAPHRDEQGYLTGLPIIPQPVQGPLPPLYAVTQHAEGFRQAARQGLGVITSHPAPKRFASLNEVYREEADKVGRAPHVGSSAIMVRDFCLAETDGEARALIGSHIEKRFELITRVRGLGEWLDLGEDPEDPKLQAMNGFDLLNERDFLLVGSPETVTERLVRMSTESDVEHWMLALGQVDQASAVRSMRLMAEEVLPEVRRRLAAAGARSEPAVLRDTVSL